MSGIHALIVEDDPYSVEVLGRLLRNEGIQHTAVSHLDEISLPELREMGVVFLDLDMPGMNGYEVYNILRHEYGLGMPIVAYTVNTNEKATTRQVGFDGMLGKPLDSQCFREQLRRILAGEAMWDDC